MSTSSRRRARILVGAIGVSTLSVAIGALPAFAEGNWSSSISGAAVGFSSRSWQDSNVDAAHTGVTFSGCSVDFAPSGFSSTDVNLYDEFGGFPDQSVGTKNNTCGTSDWGRMTRSDQYHWTIDGINGDGSSQPRLNVDSVTQSY